MNRSQQPLNWYLKQLAVWACITGISLVIAYHAYLEHYQ